MYLGKFLFLILTGIKANFLPPIFLFEKYKLYYVVHYGSWGSYFMIMGIESRENRVGPTGAL